MGSQNLTSTMNSLALVFCLAVAATAHPDYSDTWEEFKGKYGKDYADANEEDYRQNVWSSNVGFISSHNTEHDNGLHDFSVGENEFADMTPDEITSYFNGLTMEDSSPSSEIFYSDVTVESLPTDVDWRKNGSVTPVKNQAHCGSCWAFSATGSLEGAHYAKTGKLVSLSEQNLVDCSAKEGNHGCMGGLMDSAFKYVKDNGGIDTEASYNYTAQTGKTCLYNATNSGANLTSWVDIPHMSEADLQKAVATAGPPAGSDKKPKDFWLVKNSWGATWGMAGYINMARNKHNACGIATQASYPVV